ncbi:MAG: DUF2178 domain-containing protein [Spirochaetales bacterium]|nr:DUF2178 domain-containing protein [Spirochaetales bacterium]
MNNKFLLVSFVILIASGFIIGQIFPDLPASFYLIYGLLGGGILFVINNRRIKKKGLIVTDERINKNIEKASLVTYRFTYAITLLVGMILTVISPEMAEIRIIGLVLIGTSILQTTFFTISYLIIARKN